jgi:4-amino-4-deoxy-L-arabinose transferase-like glycosyltransferase
MIFFCFLKNISSSFERQDNLLAAGIIFLYCLVYASTRLLISSTMELDEAEQFIIGSVYSWGYSNQPPVYTWIVKMISSLFGMNIRTLIAVKYCLMFCFYFSFYLISHSFWDRKKSLLVTGSLLLFYTYSYDFNRHLSHTILVTAMASITSLIYIHLLLKKNTSYYLLLGISIGFGIISKYNFVFFLSALILASISTKEGRRMIFDRRTLLSVLICCLIILPHFLWLIHQKFPSIHHALLKAHAGELKLHSVQSLFMVIGSSFYGVVTFPLIFGIFFWHHVSLNTTKNSQILSIFRWLIFYGLMIPLSGILILRTGHFSEKWLAPVLFCVPLALFSLVDMDMNKNRFRLFGYLCTFIAIMILLVRAFIGFLPDAVGKVERIHTPFKAVSLQLIKELQEKGIHNLQDLTVVTDSGYLAVNIIVNMPGAKFMVLKNDMKEVSFQKRDVIIVWDASKQGIYIPKKFLDVFPSAIPINRKVANKVAFCILNFAFLQPLSMPPLQCSRVLRLHRELSRIPPLVGIRNDKQGVRSSQLHNINHARFTCYFLCVIFNSCSLFLQ